MSEVPNNLATQQMAVCLDIYVFEKECKCEIQVKNYANDPVLEINRKYTKTQCMNESDFDRTMFIFVWIIEPY